MPHNLLRDLFETMIVVSIGGMVVSALRRLRRGEIQVFRCPSCGRPASRAYDVCKHCRRPLAR